jgi:predicted PurR-regulated permease PerM
MNLHAVIVLLAVTLGASTFGVIGAFLAVPVAAAVAVIIRYYGEQVSERAGEASPHPEPDEDESVTAGDEHAAADEQKRL